MPRVPPTRSQPASAAATVPPAAHRSPGRPLLLLCPSLLLAAAVAGEGGLRVESVEIEGARRHHPDHVRFALIVREGASFSSAELRQAITDDIKAIQRIGPFADIQGAPFPGSQPDSIRVRYVFRELPLVNDVVLEGVSYWQRDGILKLLTTKRGGYLNDYLLENDRRAIQRKLEDDGRRHAQVAVRRRESAPGSGVVDVTFAVDAGVSVKVGQVVFVGLPPDLPRVLLREESTLLNRRGAPFQRELMALDGSALIKRIQDLGWLDARLVETRIETTDLVSPVDERRQHGPNLAPDGERDDRVVIIYTVEPGARYRLGSVSFVGATVASEAELLAAFQGLTDERTWPLAARVAFDVIVGAKLGDGHTLFPQDWFIADEVYGDPSPGGTIGAIERARRVVSNKGHARADLYPTRRLDTEKHEVHLTLEVREGPVYRIGRVDIRGNDTTRDAVVRRAMMLHPGERWNDDDLDESRRQVRRMDIFKDTPGRPLRILRQFPEDRPDQVDLVVELSETETAKLSATGGYSSATKLFAQFGYSEENFDALAGGWPFRGAGHQLNASIYTSRERNSISTAWTNPHLLDGPWSLSLSGSIDDSRLRDWDERRVSGGAAVGRNLFENDLRLSLGYNLGRLQVRNPGSLAPDDALEGLYWLHTVRSGATYDRLDARRLPTRGLLASANAAYTGIFDSSAQYLDWQLRADRYVPLWKTIEGGSTVWRVSAQWRQIDAVGEDPVPFYARFMGGGAAPNHRGYDYSDEGPRGPNRRGNDARLGGTKEFLATTEVVLPVQGTNDGVRFVLFSDTGWVWGEDEAVSVGDLRTAVGFGIRFPLALPVSLDFAWLVNPREQDNRSQVHFALGQF